MAALDLATTQEVDALRRELAELRARVATLETALREVLPWAERAGEVSGRRQHCLACRRMRGTNAAMLRRGIKHYEPHFPDCPVFIAISRAKRALVQEG